MTSSFILTFLYAGASVVVDLISDPPDESLVGQTLKRPLAFNRWLEENKSARKEGYNHESSAHSFSNYQESMPKDNSYQSIFLILHVLFLLHFDISKFSMYHASLTKFFWICKTCHPIFILEVQETALSLKLYLDHHAGFAVPFNQQRLLDSHWPLEEFLQVT